MKSILSLTILIFISFSLSAQQSKTNDIRYLMQLIKIEATMRNILILSIDKYKKEKPQIPQHVWNNLNNSIDYDSYLKKVEKIFDSNYSHTEIKYLIEEALGEPQKIPLFKNSVQQQLYEAGREFGQQYGELIRKTITSYGG